MKKIFLSVVFLLALLISFNITQAQVFVPKYLDLKTTSATLPTFNSGDSVELKVTLDNSDLPPSKTTVEYGVVRQIIKGNMTEYEPISISTTEKAYSSPDSKIVKVSIPNILSVNSTSTYVFYAKTSVADDVDKENFVVSRQNFKIKGNDAEPLTKIKYINILQSNGERFALLHGPTIYDLSKTTYKGVASSTSIEITFESNTDTTLNPNITFSKLRSDVVVPDFKPASIVIKKGLNNVIIPLPTFGYDSGVYQGILKLNNKNIPDVNFQYIVAGEMVTFSQPEYSTVPDSQKLTFNIYGTPMDFDLDPVLNNISTSSIEKSLSSNGLVYNTEFILKNSIGKELYKSTVDVDFATSTYVLAIPSNIKGITQVSIKSVNKDGEVVYEGTKDLNIPQQSNNNTVTLVILAVLLILAIISSFVFKQKYLKLLILIVALIILFLGVRIVTAASWNVPESLLSSESYTGDAKYYKQLTVNHAGSLIRFNTNIQPEPYDTNQNIQLTYKSSFEACNNYPTQAMTNLALYNGSTLKVSSDVTDMVSAYTSYGGSNWVQAISYQDHNNTYTSNWITVNLGKPAVGDKVKAIHKVTGAYGVGGAKDATVTYDIPLFNVTGETTSDKCVNGKINHVTTIGKEPYIIKIINTVATNEPCVGDSTATSTATTTTTGEGGEGDTGGGGNPGGGGANPVCNISSVGNDQSLNESLNLCTTNGGKSITNTFSLLGPSSMYPVASWNWKCKNTDGSFPAEVSCSARCAGGLNYCSKTKTCTASCDGDKCSTIPGDQKSDDPIYEFADCATPTLELAVKFDKPYADQATSKCSISWITTVNPLALATEDYTKCYLDGNIQVPISGSRDILVGQHNLVCQTVVEGNDFSTNKNAVVSSSPITKNFKCSRVPVSGEN